MKRENLSPSAFDLGNHRGSDFVEKQRDYCLFLHFYGYLRETALHISDREAAIQISHTVREDVNPYKHRQRRR